MKNTKITGRPATPINWPTDTEFTVADIAKNIPNLTSVTIQCRINKALKDGLLSIVGERRAFKTGRAAITYKTASVLNSGVQSNS